MDVWEEEVTKVIRVELRTESGDEVEGYTFPEPIPLGEEYVPDEPIELDNTHVGAAYPVFICDDGRELRDDRFSLILGETMTYHSIRVDLGD